VVLELDALLVQLLLEGAAVALQVGDLQLLVPQLSPQGVDLVAQLRDVAHRSLVLHLEVPVVVGLSGRRCTFSSLSSL
jgi:hypothetical protein